MRERGFTISELMISLALLLSIGGTVAGVAYSMHQRERTTAGYTADLHGLRRAVRHLQNDLRAVATVGEVDYVLRDGTLLRKGQALMRNVAAFQLTHEGRLARVRLQLGARSHGSARREAVLDFRVRMRGREGGPR